MKHEIRNGWKIATGGGQEKTLRVTRATYNLILDVIAPYIFKEPTNLNPEPISVERQLGLTLYRLGHGVSYSTLSQLFGVLISLASEIFNKVCRVLVGASYDQYFTLPNVDEEWELEVKAFIENYEFPYVGAWDGFHVYVSSKLRSFKKFKKTFQNFVYKTLRVTNFQLAFKVHEDHERSLSRTSSPALAS